MADDPTAGHRERTPEELAAMLVTLLDIEAIDTDLYRGPRQPGGRGRVFGGQVIAQALQHRAAHLYSELEVARAAVLKAQQLLDAGSDAADEAVSVAKAMTGMATTLSVQEGVQMHGGIGMTDELEIGFFMKRARVADALLGDGHFHADRWARLNGY